LNNPAGFVLASLRDSPYGHGKEPVSAGSGKKKYVSPASTNVTLFIHRAVDLAGRSFWISGRSFLYRGSPTGERSSCAAL